MPTRTRELCAPVKNDELGFWKWISNNVIVTPARAVTSSYVPHRVVTTDEIHPRHPYQGGPFDLRSYSISYSDGNGRFGYPVDLRNGLLTDYSYTGNFRVKNPSGSQSVPTSNSAYVSGFGARAWAKYNPTKPIVSASIFLAELRDFGPKAMIRQLTDLRSLFRGLCKPSYLTTRTGWLNLLTDMQNPKRVAKDLSRVYLAYQFGWKPFLKDLRTWLDSIASIDKRVAHLIRNNGKWQRKGGTLFDTTSSSDTTSYCGLNPEPTYYVSKSGNVKAVTTEKCWFQGSFRYYIPELDDPKWGRFKAHRMLYDLTIGPEQLWKLMPYTWLFDWFGRFGNVITNLQTQWHNQLTAKYAYLMCTKTVKTESVSRCKAYTQTYAGLRTYYSITAQSTVTQTNKVRVAASPFGFNVAPADLDPWKLSILSALGISKLRF